VGTEFEEMQEWEAEGDTGGEEGGAGEEADKG